MRHNFGDIVKRNIKKDPGEGIGVVYRATWMDGWRGIQKRPTWDDLADTLRCLREVRFERLLHLRGEFRVDTVFELKADTTVVVAWLLLRGVHIIIEAEAHVVLWLLSKSSSVD